MSWREEFWSTVYDHRQFLWLLVVFMLFLFVLNGLSFVFGHPTAESRAVALLNLGLIVGTIVAAVGTYRYATRRVRRH